MFKWNKKQQQSKADLESRVVIDLDRMIVDSVTFQFGGNFYEIKPLTTAEFLKVSQRLAVMDSLRTKKQITDDELVEAYGEFFHSMCPDMSRKQVEQMTPQQVAALFQLMVDCVTGKAYTDAESEKKKNLGQQNHQLPN